MSRFNNIIVVGRGSLAERCMKTAVQLYPNCVVRYYKVEEKGTVKSASLKIEGNAVVCSESRKVIMDELERESVPSLVLSICNPYLFPSRVVDNPVLYLVNVHHALLPRHKGRNAESWAVFEGDKTAGITWHEIVAEVDAGRIICQMSMEMGTGKDAIPAVKVFQKLNALALASFPDVLKGCMEGTASLSLMPECDEPIHYSKDIPGGGVLDLAWSADVICQFLCAMDYGVLYTMGRPRMMIDGKSYIWKRYTWEDSVCDNAIEYCEEDKEIRIYKDGRLIRLLGVAENIVSA